MNPNTPTTFAELFRTMPDAYNGIYQPYLAQYSWDSGHAPEDTLGLSTLLFPHDQVPSVFLYQTNEGTLCTVHHLHVLSTPIGQAPGPWTDKVIGFSSDIHGGHITPLLMPTAEIFSTAPATIVPTVATMVDRLATSVGGYIHPLIITEADVETIQSRRMIPVPHAYVHQLLFRELTPIEAWNQVGMQIVNDGRAADCAVLINFLRMAAVATMPPLRTDPNLPPAIALTQPVVPPIADEVFYAHLTRRLRNLLPGGTMAPTPNAMLQQVVHSQTLLQQTLQEAAVDSRVARLQERELAQAPRTFTDTFPAQADRMHRLCLATSDDGLPEFWRLFARANGKIKITFPLLQELVTARSHSPDSASAHPLISAPLFVSIANFQLGLGDPEDLKVGLSPFMICIHGHGRAAAQRQLNDQYLLINSGTAPSLADTRLILPPSYNIPGNIYQLVEFIAAYSVLLDVLLGPAHPLSVRLREHWRFWDTEKTMVINAIMTEQHGLVILGTLRYLQMVVLRYISGCLYSPTAPPLPDFSFLENCILIRTFGTLPPMPAEFYYDQARSNTKTAPSSQLPLPAPPAGSAALPAKTPGQRTTGTLLQAPVGDIVPGWHAQFSQQAKTVKMIKEAYATILPKDAAGTATLCLSYHLRGCCYDNCRNKATHRKLDATESTAFAAFLTKAL